MFGFVRRLLRPRQSKIEQLLREVLAERERVVLLLVEQVEFLRSQVGAATVTVTRAASGLPPVDLLPPISEGTLAPQFDIPSHLIDEADELWAMKEAGAISEFEYDQAMSRLKTRSADSIIE